MNSNEWVVHNPKFAARVPFDAWLEAYMDVTDHPLVQHFTLPQASSTDNTGATHVQDADEDRR